MIYTSPYKRVERFTKHGIFASTFDKNPRMNWEDVALTEAASGRSVTYRELKSTSLRLADGLSKRLKQGETFCIFSPNSLIYPALLLAAPASLIIATTANPTYTTDELAFQLSNSGAKMLVTTSDLLKIGKQALKLSGLPSDALYILPGMDGKLKLEGEKSWEELLGSDSFEPAGPQPDSSVAYLPYSSGTTGRPKGVQLSHTQVEGVSQQISGTPGFSDKRTVLIVLPFYHLCTPPTQSFEDGLSVILMHTLSLGGRLIVMPKFDLIEFCTYIQKYKVTHAPIVPPMGLGLIQHPDVPKFDFSSLRMVMCGAAPISVEVAKKIGKIAPLVQGYGMSETTGILLLPDIHAHVDGSCGKLVANTEARLVDEDGNDVKSGERGELWARGPNVLLAYHDNLKATLDTKTPEGWLKTGDVCIRYDSGDFIIVDRVKELIKVNALQVAPAELEALILECPLVRDVGVIGVFSEEKQTEYPRAYIVPAPGHAKDSDIKEKVAAFVAERAAPHKRLGAGVIVVDAIPKNPSGKILRKELRALAAKEGKKSKL